MRKPVPVPVKSLYKTAPQALKAAVTLLKRPGTWTQKAFARTCDGHSMQDVRKGDAVAFCAMGAVMFVDGPGEKKAVRLLIKAAGEIKRKMWSAGTHISKTKDDVYDVNDQSDRKKAKRQVFAMFKRALELARA